MLPVPTSPARTLPVAAKWAVFLASVSLLAGCCSGVTTDPRQGGLAGGVCGEVTGSYERRLQSRESELAGLAVARRGLEARLNAERGKAGRLERSIAEARRSEADDRVLDEDIGRERAARDRSRAEKAALEAEIAALDRELAELVADSDRQSRQLAAIQSGRATAANETQVKARLSMLGERRAQVQAKIRSARSKLSAH